MRKGIKNFCNGHCSTSTLDQRRPFSDTDFDAAALPTLEDMIMRLELEEGAARRLKLEDESADYEVEEEDYYCGEIHRRKSCVDSSDRILRSAKDALNQYPRFSLDGKDAMCRSSFAPPRTSTTCDGCDEMKWKTINSRNRMRRRGRRRRSDCLDDHIHDLDSKKVLELGTKSTHPPPPPRTLAGEAVVWCKPGVVAKLMGLEALPVPLRKGKFKSPDLGTTGETREMHSRHHHASTGGFNSSRGRGRMKGGVLGLG